MLVLFDSVEFLSCLIATFSLRRLFRCKCCVSTARSAHVSRLCDANLESKLGSNKSSNGGSGFEMGPREPRLGVQVSKWLSKGPYWGTKLGGPEGGAGPLGAMFLLSWASCRGSSVFVGSSSPSRWHRKATVSVSPTPNAHVSKRCDVDLEFQVSSKRAS